MTNPRDKLLTKRQASILEFMRQYQADYGAPPSAREIGEAFNISSPNGVMCHIRALKAKGAIVQRGGGSGHRKWQPTPESVVAQMVRLWGQATKGQQEQFLRHVRPQGEKRK